MKFGGLVAVNSFNASIDKGQIVGLIGPNGAGKTTVFNVITGVYRPTEGNVLEGPGKELLKDIRVQEAYLGEAVSKSRDFLFEENPFLFL